MNLTEKKKALLSYIKELMSEDCILAFSGGVDSSLLLKLCCDAAGSTGRKVYAVTFHTKLHPQGDLKIARKVAQETGASQKMMQYYMIFMIAAFGLMWPAAMSLYWAINSLVNIVKTLLVQKMIDKQKGFSK